MDVEHLASTSYNEVVGAIRLRSFVRLWIDSFSHVGFVITRSCRSDNPVSVVSKGYMSRISGFCEWSRSTYILSNSQSALQEVLQGKARRKGETMKDTAAGIFKYVGSGSGYKEAEDKVVGCEEQERTRETK